MKKLFLLLTGLLAAALLFAQQAAETPSTSLAEPNSASVGVDTAKQFLKEVSVELFEREASWSARISPDDGIISARLFEGGPNAKDPLPDGMPEGTADGKVLGVKVDFFRRGHISFYVTSTRPVPIEGITKTISIWVAGRNFEHNLTLLVRDVHGNMFELPMGMLNFSGWKKMTVAIPASPDGKRGIVQNNYRSTDRAGLSIVGFKIDCDPLEAYGSYYMYFDDMRAVTDLYQLEARDPDDMSDAW